jgi:arylamine N-acetyltransferase
MRRQHMVILTTINSKLYLIDVGFSNFGTLSPMLLKKGELVKGVPGLEAQLAHRPLLGTESGQNFWILETRDSHSGGWKNGYCFCETEFFPPDFESMSYRAHTDPTSWFTTVFILTKVILDNNTTEGVNSEVIGTLNMVGSILQRRVNGKEKEVLLVCNSEPERIAALEKWFGVFLTTEEHKAIKGCVSEIE